MKEELQSYIEEESKKLIDRHHLYHNSIEIEYQRNQRRIKNPMSKIIYIPDQWKIDKKFNPFYVYSHSKQISFAISEKLKNGTYEPFKPYIKEIPKKGGKGKRTITIYQIPDAAVSNYLYKRLLSKNKHRFSSLSYAYRNDRNAHYAVQDIALEISQYPRVFISEFDFRDFFGSVNHEYLFRQLKENGFLVSEFERDIIDKFIKINDRGIPQGTSISLFLANLVCWKLDRQLEQEGLRFARYADDTVVWSNDYSKICKSLDVINDFSKEAGIEINLEKSSGISLLTKREIPSEITQTKEFVEFLGYRLSADFVGIKDESIRRIKKQIAYLLYRNLIQPLKFTTLQAVTIPNSYNNDPAFVTAIMQIRRYLYGNLNEEKLMKYLNGAYKRLVFKGIMSYYPLITDEKQMKKLDSWLVTTIMNSLRLRKKLFLKHGFDVAIYFPYNISRNNILDECKKRKIKGKKGLIQIPSFMKIYRAIKMGVINDGIEETMNPNSIVYDY